MQQIHINSVSVAMDRSHLPHQHVRLCGVIEIDHGASALGEFDNKLLLSENK